MTRMDGKSPTIRTLENNMIRYFADYQRRTSGSPGGDSNQFRAPENAVK